MGVYCLNSYSKQVGALKRVSLIQEIQQYRLETNLSPVIVVDGVNFCYAIGRSKNLPWLTGGSSHEFEKYFKLFVRNLKANFAEVVFFFDGINWLYNRETWIKRRKENINEFYKNVFDKLDVYATVDEIETCAKRKLIYGSWTIANKVLIEEGCQAIKAICDCDFEISAYVKKHKCMGIIADDTDFIINCSCNIYTTNELNIDCMTLMKRDRDKLLKSLAIEPKMLPLFASLVGNDIITKRELNHIRSKFQHDRGIDLLSQFCFIARYIMNLNIKGSLSDIVLTRVANDIFNDPTKVALLRRSIDSYDASPEKIEAIVEDRLTTDVTCSKWSTILKMAFIYQRQGGGTSYLFSILAQNTYQNVESLEDLRKKDLPPINKILRPLRKKIYGVLLHEKPGEHIVTEMVVDSHDTFEPCFVEAIPPKVIHPGLVAIWGRLNEEDNWALLGDVIGVQPSKITSLPYHLIIPTLAFKYLKEICAIEKWEIIAALLSSVIASYMSEQSLSAIRLRRVQSRAVRLNTLMIRAYETIRLLIESLGNIIPLVQAGPTLYHDGNIFHLIYNSMKEGIKPMKILKIGFEKILKQKIEACEATFDQITAVVFEDTGTSFL